MNMQWGQWVDLTYAESINTQLYLHSAQTFLSQTQITLTYKIFPPNQDLLNCRYKGVTQMILHVLNISTGLTVTWKILQTISLDLWSYTENYKWFLCCLNKMTYSSSLDLSLIKWWFTPYSGVFHCKHSKGQHYRDRTLQVVTWTTFSAPFRRHKKMKSRLSGHPAVTSWHQKGMYGHISSWRLLNAIRCTWSRNVYIKSDIFNFWPPCSTLFKNVLPHQFKLLVYGQDIFFQWSWKRCSE